jgi:lactobin A/cerein 7B family class IIb bacteriocin
VQKNHLAMKKLTTKEMENTQGGMACWLATAALVAAGILFTATAGAGFFITGLGLVSLGFPLVEYMESCYPELMQ